MRKLALVAATVVGAVVFSAAPISVKWSAEKNLSVSLDKAYAGGWKACNARKRSRRQPQAYAAGGATLRGGRDLPALLDVQSYAVGKRTFLNEGWDLHLAPVGVGIPALSGPATPVPRVSAGQPAAASNAGGPTTGRSRPNISTPTLARATSRRSETSRRQHFSRVSTRAATSATTPRSSARA
jgi:hypothetical protein